MDHLKEGVAALANSLALRLVSGALTLIGIPMLLLALRWFGGSLIDMQQTMIYDRSANALLITIASTLRFTLNTTGLTLAAALDVGTTVVTGGACTIGGALTVSGASATVNGGTVNHSALSAGALGGLACAKSNGAISAAKTFGDTIAGTELTACNADGADTAGTLTGTWRCLGAAAAGATAVWQRVA